MKPLWKIASDNLSDRFYNHSGQSNFGKSLSNRLALYFEHWISLELCSNKPVTPALFTRMSSRYSLAMKLDAKSRTDLSELKSSLFTTTFSFPVSFLIFVAASSPFSVLRQARITRAFLLAKSYAVW